MKPDPSQEPRLLRRLLRAESGAWDELIREYGPILLSIARRTFSNYGFNAAPQDAEDAVAIVWRNLLEHDHRVLRQCAARNALLPGLVTLTRHRAVDIMRKHRGDTVEFEPHHGGAEDPPPVEPEPGMDDALLRRAVADLPAREQTLVTLFFLQRRRYRDIATLTGIPQNSIGPTLARALRHLRDQLEKTHE